MEGNLRLRCPNKIAVVTGATAGIGLATVTKLVEEGATVYMMVRNLAKAAPIIEKLNAMGPGSVAEAIYYDAQDLNTIEPALKEIFEKAGRIDMFVNNALGTSHKAFDGMVAETSPAAVAEISQGVLGASAECLRVVIPMMIQNGGGSIVNVGSTAGAQADTTRTFYGCMKAAVHMLTQYTALQYGRQGIRCNAVLPGFTAAQHTLEYLGQAFVDAWVKHAYIGRTGKTEDQANAIVFFLSDEASWITGQLLQVSGGFGLGSPSFADTFGNC